MPAPSRQRSTLWRIGAPVAAGLAGVLFVASALSADGIPLRSNVTDLGTLVAERARSVETLRAQERQLRGDVAQLTAAIRDGKVTSLRRKVAALEPAAGLTPVRGAGLQVTLDDAPPDQELPDGVNPNLLVVHQQDIQGFVNALWAGGASAISLQDQRLISTTGIKCVGNTVVLQGVPYSPPYVIEAVGDIDSLRSALEESQAVRFYRDYVVRFALGLAVESVNELDIAAYEESVQLQHARQLA